MTLTRAQALALVDERINEMDLDWPTKPKHVVFDEITRETDAGWVLEATFYYC